MKFDYLSLITEMTSVQSMPTNFDDEREYQDYQKEQTQQTIEAYAHEATDYVQLQAVLAVAQSFKYDVSSIEFKLVQIQEKTYKQNIFELDFDMALLEVQERKENQIESLFTTYEVMKAADLT